MAGCKRKEIGDKGKGKMPVVGKSQSKKQKTAVRTRGGGIRISEPGRGLSANPRAIRAGQLRDETSDDDFEPDTEGRNSSSDSDDSSEETAEFDSEAPLSRVTPRVARPLVSQPPHPPPTQPIPQTSTEPQPQVASASSDPLPYDMRFSTPQALSNYEEFVVDKKMCFERGLDLKVVPKPFVDNLRSRGWNNLILEPEGNLNLSIVREWYANFTVADLERGTVWVRGVNVPWSVAAINGFYRTPTIVGDHYEEWFRDKNSWGSTEDPLERMRIEINPELQWMSKGGNTRSQLLTTTWPDDWKVKAKFSQNRLLPKDNITHFHIKDLQLLYALHYKLKVDVGRTIFTEFRENQKNKRRLIMCPYLIYGLCRDARVGEYADDQIRKSKVLPIMPKSFNARSASRPSKRLIHTVLQPFTPTSTTSTTLPMPPPPLTTITTTTIPPPPSSGPSTSSTTLPPPTPTIPFTGGPWLSERQGLLIAHKQRDWMDSLRIMMNGLLKNQKAIARAQQVHLPHRDLDTTAFQYTPEIEADLQRITESLLEDESDEGSEVQIETEADDSLDVETETGHEAGADADSETVRTGAAETTQPESAVAVTAPSSSTQDPPV